MSAERAVAMVGKYHEIFEYEVTRATADTVIMLDCLRCDTRLTLGPRTGPHDFNLPWLTSQCPTCGARYGVQQRIEITWDGGGA